MNPNLFQIHCTWKAVDGKNITEAVTWADVNENSDIEETIQAENCLLLENSGKSGLNTECRLSLLCQPPYAIQQVAALCEARLIEVYGQHQEYLRTLRCEMVDEMDDMIVFRAEVKLDKPVSECSLKFTGLKCKTSMWLYGVVVYVGLPQPSTNVLLSAAQRFTSQQGVQERGQVDGQLMALMSFMGSQGQHKAAVEQIPQSPMQQQQPPQLAGPFPQMFGQPSTTQIGPQYIQQPFQMPSFAQVPAPAEPVINRVMGNLFPKRPESNANVPESSNVNQQPQVPPELAQMLQLFNSPNAVNLMSNLLQKMQNEKLETDKPVASQSNSSVPEATSQNAPNVEQVKVEHEETKSTKPVEQSQVEPAVTAVQQPVAAPEVSAVPTPTSATTVTEKKATEVSQAVAAPSTPSITKVVSEPLSEAVAVSKLSGGAVEQISESVVTNMECSLEHLEERLWGKVRHRLQEMETKILHRLDEMFDALHEEVESESRDLQEDLDDEEETLSMGPEGGVLEI